MESTSLEPASGLVDLGGCDVCGGDHETVVCPVLGLDAGDMPDAEPIMSRARLTLPHNLLVADNIDGSVSILAKEFIPGRTKFGPYEARRTVQQVNFENGFVLKMFNKDGAVVSLDTTSENECNWMCFVAAATSPTDQNCMALQIGLDIFYTTTRPISAGTELKVWYAPHYAKKLGKQPVPDGVTTVLLGQQWPTFSSETLLDVQTSPNLSVFSTPTKQIELRNRTNSNQSQTPNNRSLLLQQASDSSSPLTRATRQTTTASSVFPSSMKAPKDEPADRFQDASFNQDDEPFDTWTVPEPMEIRHPRQSHIFHPFDEKGLQKCRRCNEEFADHKELALHVKKHLKKQKEKTNKTRARAVESMVQTKKSPQNVDATNKVPETKPLASRMQTRNSQNKVSVSKQPATKLITSKEIKKEETAEIDVAPRRSSRSRNTEKQREIMEALLSKARKKELKEEGMTEKETDLKTRSTRSAKVLHTPRRAEKESTKVSPTKQTPTGAQRDSSKITPAKSSKVEQQKKVTRTRGRPRKRRHSDGLDKGVKEAKSGEDNEKLEVDSSKSDNEIFSGEGQNDEEEHVGKDKENVIAIKQTTSQAREAIDTSLLHEGMTDLERLTAIASLHLPVEHKDNRLGEQGHDTGQEPISDQGQPDATSKGPATDLQEHAITNQEQVTDQQETCLTEDNGQADAYISLPVRDNLTNDPSNTENKLVEANNDSEANHLPTEKCINTSENDESIDIGERNDNVINIIPLSNKENEDNGATTENREDNHYGNQTDATGEVMEDPQPTETNVEDNGANKTQSEAKATSEDYKVITSASGKVQYCCTKCSKKFDKLGYLERHMNTHTDRFHCTDCNHNFARKETLLNHTCAAGLKSMGNKVIYPCEICGKKFEKLKYMQRHMRGHSGEFGCKVCERQFTRKESLLKHQCTGEPKEEDEGPHYCEFCGQEFKNQKYLFRHMSAHTGEFTCKNCGRSFSRKESQLNHMAKCAPDVLKEELKGDKGFICTICSKVFGRETSLENHMLLHYGQFQCSDCGKYFTSQSSLDKHKCTDEVTVDSDAIVAEPKGFECNICCKVYSKQKYLDRHMAIHTGEFHCNICQRQFCRKEELNKHLLQCTAKLKVAQEGKIQCPSCTESFVDAEEFYVHYMDHTHPYKCSECHKHFLRKSNYDHHKCEPWDGKPVSCNICGKEFRLPKYLQRHALTHESPKYNCQYCHRTFCRIDYLNDHTCIGENGEKMKMRPTNISGRLRRKMTKPQQYICSTCGKTYVSMSNLNKHAKTHGDKTEVCEICGKTFHLKVQLKEHLRSHSDKVEYECPYCKKKLKCRNSISMHVKHFHREQVDLFVCTECGKGFKQKGNLKKHELVHSNKKHYKCSQCPKEFRYPEQLRRHVLWHNEGERFTCSFCDRAFVMEFELRKHVKVFHSGYMYLCPYCSTECRHYHTMKRHIERRHNDVDEWKADTPTFINNLLVQNDKYKQKEPRAVRTVPQNIQSVTTLTPSEPVESIISAHSITDAKLLTDATGATQTVIIHQMGDSHFETDGVVSQEVAEALQSLSSRGMLDGQETTTMIIGDASGAESQAIPVTLTGTGLGDGQGFIIVPMITGQDQDSEKVHFTSENVA